MHPVHASSLHVPSAIYWLHWHLLGKEMELPHTAGNGKWEISSRDQHCLQSPAKIPQLGQSAMLHLGSQLLILVMSSCHN